MRRSTTQATVCTGALVAQLLVAVQLTLPVLFAVAMLIAEPAVAVESGQPLGLGDPGALVELSIQTGRDDESPLMLFGSDPQQQLVVTGIYASGQQRDLTSAVVYQAEPSGVVTVDEAGLVRPRGNGTATVSARTAGGLATSLQITVESFERNPAVNFPNQVVPIFTKLQCNSGGCHGKSGGQNGFRLSLLGFEPGEDYEHLVKEARGRRLNPSAPDQSLLLQKAAGLVPHGGGARLEPGSPNYALLRRWIAEGAAFGNPEAARVASIEVFPKARMMGPTSQQQLVVIARYTDGSTADVTATAGYEPNVPEMAEVSERGLVSTRAETGDVAIMIRYQSHVAVFRATIPLGASIASMPEPRNFIDQAVFDKLQLLGLPPSPIADDATFLRRVTIDVAGRLPTAEEAAEFLADPDPAKRDQWIERLLASSDYADNFAKKWSAMLRNKRAGDADRHGTYAFHAWIHQSLYENLPYDELVRGVIAASGDVGENPGVVWYRQVREPTAQAEDAAQLFLGIRMQCAKCHHHPFEKWSERDYYSFTAFFSQVGRKPGDLPNEERIYHKRGEATATNPKDGEQVVPAGLGGEPLEIPAEEDPRQWLVDWMAAPDNPYFARMLANRYWKHFFGRGLVDPEDDMRETNPATNPELLDALARHFIDSGFDMKDLVRTICQSRTYQLSSVPNEYNIDDRQNFSRYYPKRLPAEVMLDAIDRVTGSPTRFAGVPMGTRALQLPDSGFDSYFLTVFGRPEGDSACECERADNASLAQSLHLINSADVLNKVSDGGGRAAKLASDGDREMPEKIRELYLTALSRPPTEEEARVVAEYISKSQEEKANARTAYEDVLWTLINTKEFLFNN